MIAYTVGEAFVAGRGAPGQMVLPGQERARLPVGRRCGARRDEKKCGIRLTPVLTTCTSLSNSGLSGTFTVFKYEVGFRGLRQTRYTSLPALL